MRCGSLELRNLKASEGAMGVAFFDLAKCRECGWQGNPLEFDSEPEWRDFVAAQSGWKDAAGGSASVGGTTSVVQIMACRQCGSRDVRLEGTAGACPHCRWRGDPKAFPDEASWLAFAETRKNLTGKGGEAG